jgi:SNF2 family DNA or RNA helicase
MATQEYIFNRYSKYIQSEIKENPCVRDNKNELKYTNYQKFLEDYSYNNFSKDKNKGILLYHKVGSGKTITSILMSEKILEKDKYKKVIVMLPASLRVNYNTEIEKINVRNKDNYSFLSYNNPKLDLTEYNFNNKIIVIDEIQNLISMVKNKSKIGISIYKKLLSSDCKIIALSGTPVSNIPYEYAILLNLLRPNSFKLNNYDFIYEYINLENYSLKNDEKFYRNIKGLISYYSGHTNNRDIFPKSRFSLINCPFSDIQEKVYLSTTTKQKTIKKKEEDENKYKLLFELNTTEKDLNNFHIKSRLSSNSIYESLEDIKLENLLTYSTKYYYIMENIQKTKGNVVIYSNFINKGLLELEKILKLKGIENYKWIGGQTDEERQKILKKFNSSNDTQKVLLISKAGAEGLSLKNVRQLHILEPHWNVIRIKQIIGRVIRMCSHYSLPKEEQLVDIFMYLTTLSNTKKQTIDQYIHSISEKKLKILSNFEKMIEKSALDCKLFLSSNKDVDICHEEEKKILRNI